MKINQINSRQSQIFFVSIMFLLIVVSGIKAQSGITVGGTPPAMPAVLAPGVISTGLAERDFTISPSGDEIFYTIQSSRFVKSAIIQVRKVNNVWQQPEIAPFSGKYKDLEASFSPDGNTLYFSSNRPVNEMDTIVDFDIWKVIKKNNGWSEPIHLGNIVNTTQDEFYPSVTKSGNLYFTVTPENGYGREDIVMCANLNGVYQPRIILDSAINTKGYEFNAFVDPEEKYIIFTSLQGRRDEMGGGDLYISKKNGNGSWGTAFNLGKKINSAVIEYCPFVSWDKKTLFFTSPRNLLADKLAGKIGEYRSLLQNAGNGYDDIYTVDISDILQ